MTNHSPVGYTFKALDVGGVQVSFLKMTYANETNWVNKVFPYLISPRLNSSFHDIIVRRQRSTARALVKILSPAVAGFLTWMGPQVVICQVFGIAEIGDFWALQPFTCFYFWLSGYTYARAFLAILLFHVRSGTLTTERTLLWSATATDCTLCEWNKSNHDNNSYDNKDLPVYCIEGKTKQVTAAALLARKTTAKRDMKDFILDGSINTDWCKLKELSPFYSQHHFFERDTSRGNKYLPLVNIPVRLSKPCQVTLSKSSWTSVV